MTDLEICHIVQDIFENWPKLKHTTPHFGFREYIKDEYGIEYYGHTITSFQYKVVDNKKFMWFLLKYATRQNI